MITPIYTGTWGDIFVELPEKEFKVGNVDSRKTIFIHVKQRQWSAKVYKEMLTVWADLILEIKDAGYDHVASLIPKENKLTNRFQSMFGLKLYARLEGLNLHVMEL